MRRNTMARRQAYVRALRDYDRAEVAGDTQLADLIYDGLVLTAASRLPVGVRGRLDDENPALRPLP